MKSTVPPLRPLVRRVAVFLAGGLALSVVAAWAIPILRPSTVTSADRAWASFGGTLWFFNCERRPGLRYWQIDAVEFLDPHADSQTREDRLTSWHRRVQSSEPSANPQLLDQWALSFLQDLSGDRYAGTKTVDVVETGFPFPALSFVATAAPQEWSHRLEQPTVHWGWKISQGPLNSPNRKLILPLHPRWDGLLLNTAVFSCALALLFFATRWAVRAAISAWTYRTRLRLRLGLCPKCSYDLRNNHADGCPECGWGK